MYSKEYHNKKIDRILSQEHLWWKTQIITCIDKEKFVHGSYSDIDF